MEITLEITRECALNCIMCSSNGGIRDNQELSTDEWIDVINQARDYGFTEVCISGGEPFLRPDLITIVRHAKQKGLMVTVYTSGSYYDQTRMLQPLSERILEEVSEYADKLAVGFHGPNSKIHDAITQVDGSFARLSKSIKLARNLGFNITGHFVPMKMNFMFIEETIDVAIKMELSKLGLLRFVPQGRGRINQDSIQLDPDELDLFVSLIGNLKPHESKFIKIGAPFGFAFPDNTESCTLGRRMTIQPNGILSPCEALKEYSSQFLAFNVRNSTLGEIMNSNWIDELVSEYNLSIHSNKHCIAQELEKEINPSAKQKPDGQIQLSH